MNKINTEITEADKGGYPPKSDRTLANEILENLKNAVPFSVTFVQGIDQDKKEEVENQLRYRFELWANTWIAPKCRQIIAKGSQ